LQLMALGFDTALKGDPDAQAPLSPRSARICIATLSTLGWAVVCCHCGGVPLASTCLRSPDARAPPANLAKSSFPDPRRRSLGGVSRIVTKFGHKTNWQIAALSGSGSDGYYDSPARAGPPLSIFLSNRANIPTIFWFATHVCFATELYQKQIKYTKGTN